MSTDVTQQHPAGPPGADPEPRESWLQRHRRLVVIGSAAAILIGGGAAYAYWTSTGEGASTVNADTAPEFVVTSSPGTGGALSPGGPIQTVAFNVQNPSSGVLNLASVTAAVANPDGTPWTSGDCSAADFAVGTPATTYGDIAPGADVDGTVTVQMRNLTTNQNDCQGLTVPIYFFAS